MKIEDIAILVCSHDGYSSLWRPLERSYALNWPDCPVQIYLGTNYIDPNLDFFQTLAIGEESSWSDYLQKCISQIDEKYVILTFDDLFLKRRIDNRVVVPLIERAIEEDWNYLRMHPSPRGRIHLDTDISLIDRGALYRTSAVFALFKKDVLNSLLNIEETAWEFERKGSRRSDHLDEFYVSREKVLPYINRVIKSKVDIFAAKELAQQGIDLSKIELNRMNIVEALYRKIYVVAYSAYRRIRDKFVF